jgi:hypothetical protein
VQRGRPFGSEAWQRADRRTTRTRIDLSTSRKTNAAHTLRGMPDARKKLGQQWQLLPQRERQSRNRRGQARVFGRRSPRIGPT